MSAYTPGPWRAHKEGRKVGVLTANNVEHLATIHLATIRQDANARLMAASPELLTALEACRDAIQRLAKESTEGVPMWASEAHDAARAAIAKATAQPRDPLPTFDHQPA